MTLTRLQRLCALYNWIAQREALPCLDTQHVEQEVLRQVQAEFGQPSDKYVLDHLQDLTDEILNAEIESPWHMATKLQIFLYEHEACDEESTSILLDHLVAQIERYAAAASEKAALK